MKSTVCVILSSDIADTATGRFLKFVNEDPRVAIKISRENPICIQKVGGFIH